MKLAVADAPVDGASHVVVSFTGVELTGNGGDDVLIEFSSPKIIDLITDSGTASAVLFDQPIPAGSYGQIRLILQEPIPEHSFIQTEDGAEHGLEVPSGSQTGLKLVSGFTVPDSGVANYTIDFDLRKAITCPPGQSPNCILKPAMRLVNNDSVGNIQGIVDPTLTAADGCEPGVYLYTGSVAAPADNNSTVSGSSQPLASKVPVQTNDGLYYQFTFLPPGTYTVAYTCQADEDNPDQADPSVVFDPDTVVPGVVVTAGATTDVDLPPPP
jgi:hypothetical protein